MEHSPMFEQIKQWYNSGLWTPKMVYNAVGRRITAKEYSEITGEVYA